MLQKFAEFLDTNHALEDYCFNLSKTPPTHLDQNEKDVWWIFLAFTWPGKEYARWNMLDQNWLNICKQYGLRNTVYSFGEIINYLENYNKSNYISIF